MLGVLLDVVAQDGVDAKPPRHTRYGQDGERDEALEPCRGNPSRVHSTTSVRICM